MPVPDIPGTKLPEGQQLMFLRDHVRELCRLNTTKYVSLQNPSNPQGSPALSPSRSTSSRWTFS